MIIWWQQLYKHSETQKDGAEEDLQNLRWMRDEVTNKFRLKKSSTTHIGYVFNEVCIESVSYVDLNISLLIDKIRCEMVV